MSIKSLLKRTALAGPGGRKNIKKAIAQIAQQDYIIIDWEGKQLDDASKKAEVSAMLKNIYLTNPITLLSVVFTNFIDDPEDPTYYYAPCMFFSVNGAGDELTLTFAVAFDFIITL